MTYECIESYEWGVIDDGTEGQVVGADNDVHWTSGWVLSGISCGYVSCGGGGGENGSGFYVPGGYSGSGGGTSNGDNNNDDTSDPSDPNNHGNGVFVSAPTDNPMPDPDPSDDGNCEKLHEFSTSPHSQSAFNNLEGELNSTKEKGYLVNAQNDFPFFNLDYVESSNNCTEIQLELGGTTYAVMHTHPNNCGGQGTLPMFYYGDIITLYQLYMSFDVSQTNLTPSASDFAVYMTVDGYVYALKINNLSQFTQIASIFSDIDKLRKFKRNLNRAYKKQGTTSPSQDYLAEGLLKVIDKYNLGISIYRSSHEDIKYDPRFTTENQESNWKRLRLDENNNFNDDQNC
ncbi:hypothetical protein [Psychroflexus sp. MBR-150]|jgi:hypothetical protein